MQCWPLLSYATLCYAILCYPMLHGAMLCCALLCLGCLGVLGALGVRFRDVMLISPRDTLEPRDAHHGRHRILLVGAARARCEGRDEAVLLAAQEQHQGVVRAGLHRLGELVVELELPAIPPPVQLVRRHLAVPRNQEPLTCLSTCPTIETDTRD